MDWENFFSNDTILFETESVQNDLENELLLIEKNLNWCLDCLAACRVVNAHCALIEVSRQKMIPFAITDGTGKLGQPNQDAWLMHHDNSDVDNN